VKFVVVTYCTDGLEAVFDAVIGSDIGVEF